PTASRTRRSPTRSASTRRPLTPGTLRRSCPARLRGSSATSRATPTGNLPSGARTRCAPRADRARRLQADARGAAPKLRTRPDGRDSTCADGLGPDGPLQLGGDSARVAVDQLLVRPLDQHANLRLGAAVAHQ